MDKKEIKDKETRMRLISEKLAVPVRLEKYSDERLLSFAKTGIAIKRFHGINMPYEELKALCKKEGIKNNTDYKRFSETKRFPSNAPRAPWDYYKKEWTSWYDFLDVEEFMPYEELKALCKKEGIKNSVDYKSFSKTKSFPSNAPKAPDTHYKEWTSWFNFLDIEEFMPYEELKALCKKLGITKTEQYNAAKAAKILPSNAPSAPNKCTSYKGVWIDSYSFFDTKKEFMPYEELKALCKKLGITTGKQYRLFKRTGLLPLEAPISPNCLHQYKKEWTSWYDFLDVEEFMPYEELKALCKKLGITTGEQYDVARKNGQLQNVPANPRQTYSVGWKVLLDQKFMPYEELKALCKKKKITSMLQYRLAKKNKTLPLNAPSCPDYYYEEWTSVCSFFESEWMPLQELKAFCKKSTITTARQYLLAKTKGELPFNAPTSPKLAYKEWTNWYDFFGKINLDKKKK